MRFALLCTLAADADETRRRFRAEHLEFIRAERSAILFGGPLLDDAGRPETMLLVLEAPDRAAAEAWIAREPYRRHGVFATVRVQPWAQVLPEPEPGALDQAISRERAAPS